MTDREVIDAFIVHLRDHGWPDLRLERRPDQENHSSSDIDAIAGPFAIEHTSIDALPNQRRDSDWFIRAAGGIEQGLESAPPFRLSITLEYDAVGKGQNWNKIRAALKSWVVNEASRLADGKSVLADLPSIPFRLHVVKSSDRRPGLFFGRFQPEDDTLSLRVKQSFDRKAAKLATYQAPGCTTVLLVENNDIALMSEWKMLEAIRAAYPSGPPSGVDQVWYADTCIAGTPEFRDFTQEFRKSAF